MDRLVRFNVIATCGRAVEAAGDVDALLLDKTGTITFGNRMATEFAPVNGVSAQDVGGAALAESLADLGLIEPKLDMNKATVLPFSAQRRISGLDVPGRSIRKEAIDSILRYLKLPIERSPLEFRQAAERIAMSGGTPLAVAEDALVGRHPPEGHREAGHQRAIRGDARDGHPHRHGDRRQSSPPPRSPRRHASTTSPPRRRRRTRLRSFARSSSAGD
jgi:hypothetical protein